MKQFEFRQSSSQQNSVPALSSDEHRHLIQRHIVKEESRVHRSTNGEVIIKVDAETQKLMGLKTAPLEAAHPPTRQRGAVTAALATQRRLGRMR